MNTSASFSPHNIVVSNAAMPAAEGECIKMSSSINDVSGGCEIECDKKSHNAFHETKQPELEIIEKVKAEGNFNDDIDDSENANSELAFETASNNTSETAERKINDDFDETDTVNFETAFDTARVAKVHERIAKTETKVVKRFRILLFIFLILAGSAICVATYYIVDKETSNDSAISVSFSVIGCKAKINF